MNNMPKMLYQVCAVLLALAMLFALIYGSGLGLPYDEHEHELHEGETYICECGYGYESVFPEDENHGHEA